MKKIYMAPETTIVNLGTSVETMAGLGLPVSNDFVEEGDEAAKGIDDVVDDEDGINPTEWHEEMTNAIED